MLPAPVMDLPYPIGADPVFTAPAAVHVLLLAATPRVLPAFSDTLSASAEEQLRRLGVEVRTSCRVLDIGDGRVRLENEVLPSAVTIWAAGVKASPLAAQLSNHLDRGEESRSGRTCPCPVFPRYLSLATWPLSRGCKAQPCPALPPS